VAESPGNLRLLGGKIMPGALKGEEKRGNERGKPRWS